MAPGTPVDPRLGLEQLDVAPVAGPLDGTVELPGSKSLTNRALVAAALAEGSSVLTRVLTADDTEAMLGALRALGVRIDGPSGADSRCVVDGLAGVLPPGPVTLDARLSGTTARFVAGLTALGPGPYELDAASPMRARPMSGSLDALRALGLEVTAGGEPDHLPVTVTGGPCRGGVVEVSGSASSQFLSGLLLAAPCLVDGLDLRVTGGLVSLPYVELTRAVLEAFGASSVWLGDDHDRLHVAPGGYRASTYAIEPDATAASYPWAAAAICGGRVRVNGLGHGSLQGDVRFVDVLEQMGASVERADDWIAVRGTGTLRGITVDLGDLSDTAQTLAAVAVFADSPTEVTGIGFIRRKETDRIAAVVTELRRCGIDAHETDDGFVVHPGEPQPAIIATYDDHRMAMSFALLGLRVPGITIADPGCVTKTFPGYWALLDELRAGAADGTGRVSAS